MSPTRLRSLRWRLVLAVGLATSLVTAAAACATWLSLARSRALAFDQATRDHARDIRPRLEEIAWRHAREPDLPPEELPEGSGDQGILLLGPDGRLYARSPGAPDPALLPPHPGPEGVLVDAVLPGPGPVRWLQLDIIERPPPGRRPEERPGRREPGGGEGARPRPQARLLLLRPTAPLDRGLAGLAWLLAGLAAGIGALTVGLVALIVHRLLRPLRSLGEAIATRVPGEGGPLAVPGLPAELLPVQARLDELLARVAQVLERERQTTANIAHELRTPLAGLRARLELALLRPEEPGRLAGACRQGLASLTLMQGLVDNLLLLARLEAGQAALHREAVELADVVAAAWSLHQPAAEERGLGLERDLEPALALTTDVGRLRAVLSNLLANAVAYADAGSAIRLEAAEHGTRLVLRLANQGSTIRPEEAERVFEPFWRADRARTVERGHCGLGLPLARRLALSLGGTLRVEVEGGRFIACLDLPLA